MIGMLQTAAAAAAYIKNCKFLERVTQFIAIYKKIAGFRLVK